MAFWHGYIPILVCAVLLFGVSEAQSVGTITGTVTDAAGGEKLEAVQVYIPTLKLGAVSDEQGRFTIDNVLEGTYELKADLIGYASATVAITVTAGQTTVVALQMALSALYLDEVVVTGTAFKESPISLTYAVAVVGREKMAEQGSPQAVDFFKNLGASHGVIGERNSWYNAGQAATLPESIANVNLRGLVASRTLVLFNGRRQVYVPARLIGGRFVDVNAMPSIAIDRIEVLKEGAGAIYGSDAVAGVANFLTRADFEGFEVSAAHNYFAKAGDTNLGAIWGGKLGNAHAVISAEWSGQQQLATEERDYLLLPWHGGGQRGGWSGIGNPGVFTLGAPAIWTADIHDRRCEEFGGVELSWTCRFRYQPWDNLIDKKQYIRAFAEINGSMDNGANYHIEGLLSESEIPDWLTTPSYPPIPLFHTTIMEVAPDHPGRRAFCEDQGNYAGSGNYDAGKVAEACADEETNWYFNGRTFGNSGPGRTLARQSRTWRIAASTDRDFKAFGGRDASFDVGLSYSHTSGNMNLPGIYNERLFLAFRGYGGPDCGVGVIADASSDAKMRLDPSTLSGKVPGQGNCMYFNPFNNAIEYSAQPGALYIDQRNPEYRPELANSPELREWLGAEEVNLESTADMIVADATLMGTWTENVWLNANYAAGYQFRRISAVGDPNDAGDVTINPCPVAGDRGCTERDRFGPYVFTNVHRPYEADQTVHRFFGEIPLSLGERFDVQLAANYEFHDVASSFDPKFGWRYQLSESPTHSAFLRGSIQTSFRTPSLDDVNESPLTTLEWVPQTSTYRAVDRIGSPDLKPEQAFTYNAGLALNTEAGFEATLDYWHYDFSDVIGAMPHSAIVNLYDEAATRDLVKQYIVCPDGIGTGTCTAAELDRVRIDLVNWPGIKTSGFDVYFGTRMQAGPGQFTASLEGTYTLDYQTKALMLDDLEIQPELDAVGYLNFDNPLVTSLPKLKSRISAAYHYKHYSLVSYVNYISSYEDRASQDLFPIIDAFVTWDASFLWNLSRSINIAISGRNLLDTRPPLVNVEQAYDGFTHDPKGRQLKLAVTYQFGL